MTEANNAKSSILRRNGIDTDVGVYRMSGRKKPVLAVRKGNVLNVYAHFIDDARADAFMEELSEFVGAVSE